MVCKGIENLSLISWFFKEDHTVNFYNKNGLCEKVEEYNYMQNGVIFMISH